jgi:hypothetical protein
LYGYQKSNQGTISVMTRQCLSDCPEGTWLAGHHPRNFWRIAYHALFYTHLYAMPTEHDFVPWEKHREVTVLWENPPVEEPYTKEELLSYLDYIDANIEAWVDNLDLESTESGFSWYPNLEKLDHQILNIRHLAGHMGQLSELVMSDGVSEIDWCTRNPR